MHRCECAVYRLFKDNEKALKVKVPHCYYIRDMEKADGVLILEDLSHGISKHTGIDPLSVGQLMEVMHIVLHI